MTTAARSRVRRAGLRLCACAAAALTIIAAVAPTTSGARRAAAYNPADPAQRAEYERALDLGVQAYVYGYPLLDTNRVYRTSTSVNVPDGDGGGPVNRFSHIRRLTNPTDKQVVAPNHDTLYSMAWLDLRAQPVVVHMPVVRHRFAVFELLDPYTENFASIGSVGRPAGDYAVVAPRWHGRLPHGVKQIRSPYARVWIIGRTYIRDAADTANVVKVQNEFSLTLLNRWGTAYTPPRPRHVRRRSIKYAVPGTRRGENELAFFDALGDQLKRFSPPAADKPLLKRLETIGVGPGMRPSSDRHLDAATRQGLRDAVSAGATQVNQDVQRAFLSAAPEHNGWLVAPTGTYGTDYASRAVVDAIGLGAPRSQLAIYPFTVTDADLHPLSGANRYVAHFSSRYLPFPVTAFWSMTLYDSRGFFVPNSAGIYLVNNRSNVRYDADGSLDVYIQPHPPRDPLERRNWLPAPAGRAFRLVMRLYQPVDVAGILSGRTWQPPTLLPCLPSGATATGVPCAR